MQAITVWQHYDLAQTAPPYTDRHGDREAAVACRNHLVADQSDRCAFHSCHRLLEGFVSRLRLQLQRQRLDPVRPKPHLKVVGRDDHLLDQQAHDALLLGREELLPDRVQPGRGNRNLRLVQ
jgi:hypothetical protein